MNRRRKVLLTGATGTWGRAALTELRERDEVDVRAFAMPTPADRAVLAELTGGHTGGHTGGWDGFEVAWGDLARYEDVARAVDGVDVVLHVGAVVSPLADAQPRLARKVNVGGMENVVRAVRALPDPAAVEVVGVGSVAETGDRTPPHHWGRVGDPVRVSQLDEYGQTKVVAERLLVESGLPRWTWLRQTGIFHPGMLGIRDPIMTHATLGGVMEWVSEADSARLLAGIAAGGAPEELWGRVHDIGGGEGWRLTNWQLQAAISAALGVADVRGWYRRNWFATGNFHGHWYTDSDELQELVPFRRDTFEAALARAVAAVPRSVRSAGRIPPWLVRTLVMGPISRRPRGTMAAVRRGDADEVAAHFGSLEAWRGIGDWSTFTAPEPSRTPVLLDHGYDESVPPSRWSASDLRGAAAFRGGELLTADPPTGAVGVPLVWRCAFGHVFAASPRLVLSAGHWCPECVRDSAGEARQAEVNPFLAQVQPLGEAVLAGS